MRGRIDIAGFASSVAATLVVTLAMTLVADTTALAANTKPGTKTGTKKSKRVAAEDFVLLCDGVYMQRGFDPRLTAMETRLVCGDSAKDAFGVPWSEIPPSQARYSLRTFLQARGFHEPEFIIEEESLYMRPGPRSRASTLEIVGTPPDWNAPSRRGYQDAALTPQLLDELEAWGLAEIKTAGYACGRVYSFADPDTGFIQLRLEPGSRKRILDVIDLTETQLEPGVLDRYSAYRIGDFYNQRLVDLTRRRLLDDGLLLAVALSPRCYPNGVILRRDPVLGPANEFRLGVGGNTDDGLRLRVRAKRVRWGSSASSISADIDTSLRRQEARLIGRWYYSRSQERDFIEPVIRFERLDDSAIESRAWQAAVLHGWNRELESGGAELLIGPSWLISAVTRGPGPGEATIVFLEGSLRWLSHESEFFEWSPREGARLAIDFLQMQRGWGAPFSANRVHIRGQLLWNLPRSDPPLFVLGLRYSLGTTWTDRDFEAVDLPVRFRFFAGGTDDMRGFSRRSLPLNSNGGLTEALLGVEGRFHKVLYRRLDPLAFVDIGRMGTRAVRLDRAVYLSPGVGLRWESAVGTFRGFVARGYTFQPPSGSSGPLEQWRFGLSYGEEF